MATDWKGASSNPYTFDEMCDKFSRYAGTFIDGRRIGEICHRVEQLEREDDLGVLARLLRTQ